MEGDKEYQPALCELLAGLEEQDGKDTEGESDAGKKRRTSAIYSLFMLLLLLLLLILLP